jgi:hypothetical protein
LGSDSLIQALQKSADLPHIWGMSGNRKIQRWRVSRIRGNKNEVVGVVVAPDREAAIQVAIEEHRIEDPERQRRLVAWPED